MNLNNKNEKITEVWNKMKPTDEIKNEILSDIIQNQNQKRKRPKFKRVMIIAAIMTVVFALGATAYVINEMVYYDMKGNIRKDMGLFTPRQFDPEVMEFEQTLRNNLKSDEMLFMISENSTRYNSFKIYDYNELKEYLINKNGESLSLPEYLPQDFEFKYADIHLNFTGDVNYEDFEPVYFEEKFGNIYEIYKMPEDKTQVESVDLNYYRNNDMDYISCNIGFICSNISEAISFSYYLPVNTEPEVLNMPQFKDSLIISYKDNRFDSNPVWSFKAVKTIDKKINILNSFFVSKTWYEIHSKNYVFDNYNCPYDAAMYTIHSDSISRDDIIKIAESIK